jgi:hypothetical protein
MKLVIDNISIYAVDGTLLDGLGELLSPSAVFQMDPGGDKRLLQRR